MCARNRPNKVPFAAENISCTTVGVAGVTAECCWLGDGVVKVNAGVPVETIQYLMYIICLYKFANKKKLH